MNIFNILIVFLLNFLATSTSPCIENDRPEFLYKIVTLKDLEKSRLAKYVVRSPLDTDFIHLATESQISAIVQKFWSGKEYTILKLDSKKLIGCLRYEANPGGTTKYFHLYEGIIPLDAVLDTNFKLE